jgi:predicted membrane protein
MKALLIVLAALTGIAVVFRHRLGCAKALDMRSLFGFCTGMLLGLWWSSVIAASLQELAYAAGVPCMVLRVGLAVLLGVAVAGPVRKILEDAFPRRKGDKEKE